MHVLSNKLTDPLVRKSNYNGFIHILIQGPIAFTTEGDRNIESSRVFLYQWRELDGSLSSVEVAEINVTSSVISYMEGESQETLFRSECAWFWREWL